MNINLKEFMDLGGESFKVIRNDLEIGQIEGLPNTKKSTNRKYIGFYPDADVQFGDWIIGIVSGNEFFIEDIKTEVIQGKAIQKKGYYLTKVQFEKTQKAETASVQEWKWKFVLHVDFEILLV